MRCHEACLHVKRTGFLCVSVWGGGGGGADTEDNTGTCFMHSEVLEDNAG